MDVLAKQIPSLIDKLENIKRRPQVTIGKIESKLLQQYLWGFREAAHLFAHMRYWEKYLAIVEQVAYGRGWPMNLSFTEAIREKGLAEKEIIEEMLIIEIESWKRLSALIISGDDQRAGPAQKIGSGTSK
jgi:hypothetical protein